MKRVNYDDTICALATGGGMSAIALIRISGNKSISTINNIFSKNLTDKKSHTARFLARELQEQLKPVIL